MFGERARRVVSSFVDGGGVGELEARCELPSLSSFLRVLHFCERSAAWGASHRCHRADYFWRAEGGAEEVRSSREHRAGAPTTIAHVCKQRIASASGCFRACDGAEALRPKLVHSSEAAVDPETLPEVAQLLHVRRKDSSVFEFDVEGIGLEVCLSAWRGGDDISALESAPVRYSLELELLRCPSLCDPCLLEDAMAANFNALLAGMGGAAAAAVEWQ